MSGLLRIAAIVAVVLVAGWVTWRAVDRMYIEPRAALRGDVEELRSYLAAAGEETVKRRRLERRLQALADRTLGSTAERADHELRSRLNRIGEAVGLSGLTVSTTAATAHATPARDQLRSRRERPLRDQVDLVELGAAVAGEGTLEQVLRLVHFVEAEPWPKRIDQLHLDPRKDGERFAVRVRLTTMFLPDIERSSVLPPPEEPAGFEPYATLVAHNPFRLPPAPAPQVEPQAPQPEPAAPLPFPYGDWVLTGVARGPQGAEVWLRHDSGRVRKTLTVGERLGDLVLEAAVEDAARFQEGSVAVTVVVGQSLDERKAVRAEP